jgi:hypothetical protein
MRQSQLCHSQRQLAAPFSTFVELNEWLESINASKKQATEFLDTILPRTAATLSNTQKVQLVNFREKLFSTGLTDEEKEV